MRPCLKAKEIKKEIRRALPVIDGITFREHFCTDCPYYAGRLDKQAHCMVKSCAWDDPNETFSPVLRNMIPIIEEEFARMEEKYLEVKRRREVVYLMFEDEIRREQEKNDPCNNCCYSKNGPCIGFCYRQMTSDPVDPAAPIFTGKEGPQ